METTKNKPTADEVVAAADEVRKWQREYFRKRDSIVLRKCRELEERLDQMLTSFYDRDKLYKTMQETEEDRRQLDLFMEWKGGKA